MVMSYGFPTFRVNTIDIKSLYDFYMNEMKDSQTNLQHLLGSNLTKRVTPKADPKHTPFCHI